MGKASSIRARGRAEDEWERTGEADGADEADVYDVFVAEARRAEVDLVLRRHGEHGADRWGWEERHLRMRRGVKCSGRSSSQLGKHDRRGQDAR